jgi:CRP/FNR family transcriptional regulator, cyclic AMP receptor protein
MVVNMEAEFKEYPSNVISFIMCKSTIQIFTDGQCIIRTGDLNRNVYFVLGGKAKALDYNENGKVVNYAQFVPGSFFGELSSIDGLCRSATVVAVKECKLAVLLENDFNFLVNNYASFNKILISKLVQVIRVGNSRISDLSLLGARQRISDELHRLSVTDPESGIVTIYDIPTQEAFAESLGISRETVIRVFKKLTEQGAIKRIAGRKMILYQLA